jgi:quercetin dioxygenase-like cupin family protein
MRIQAKSLDVPDETRAMGAAGRIEIVHLGEVVAGRATFQPGFRWSEHVNPVAGVDLCPVAHTGYVVSGRSGIRMADGTERELVAGDVFDIPPGHDAWVIGDEPYVAVDFSRAEAAETAPTAETEYRPPQGHKILFENEQVRVMFVGIKPGETSGMHSHPRCVVYALGPARVRFSTPDGATRESEIHEGDITWSDGGWHQVENIGDTDDVGIIVELKR